MDDTRWVKPVTFEGRMVRLEPLSLAHLDDLAAVAFEGDLWRWTMTQPSNTGELRAWFMSIVPEHRRLEVGWTWVGLAYQRSGANREAKLLQMTHAFETLGANRLEFKTDSLNEKANPGLLGIGATFEGTFRNHMIMPGGRLRHSNYYSVVREEWPAVKAALQAKLERH
jgi:hypothetical protein